MLLNQKKIGLALDVGALIGGYAIELRNYGFRGTIISFEPVADSFLRLTQKTQKDRLWEAYQLALGPKEGTISLNVGDKIWTSSVLDYSAAYKGVDPGLKSQPQEAKMVRLDDWTFRNRLQEKRMFIKLDVQGYERECLEGARGILNNVQMIQCELSLSELYTGSWMFGEALDWFEDNGFTLYQCEPVFVDKKTARLLQVDGLFVRPKMN
jgi:FkbM family methyltransferase